MTSGLLELLAISALASKVMFRFTVLPDPVEITPPLSVRSLPLMV